MLGADEPATLSSSSIVAVPALSRYLTICSDRRLMDSDIAFGFYRRERPSSQRAGNFSCGYIEIFTANGQSPDHFEWIRARKGAALTLLHSRATRRLERSGLRADCGSFSCSARARRFARALLMPDEFARLQFVHRLLQLGLRVHHDRPVPRHRLLERLAADKQEANPLRPGLHHDLVAAIEENERVVLRVVDRLRIGIDPRLGQHSPRRRCVAKRPRSREDISKCVACRLHLDGFALEWWHRDVDIARIHRVLPGRRAL